MNEINFVHPQQKNTEFFVSNINTEDFNKLSFSSKRRGTESYDGLGNKIFIEDWLPFFISKEELESNSLSIKEIRKQLSKKTL